MIKCLAGVCIALAAGLVLISAAPQITRPTVEEYPEPLVRERQLVVIEGVTEQWELRWKAPPTPACEPNDTSLTCPCTGFAYGEGGDLTLVRIRGECEIDSLNLTFLFKNAHANPRDIAILQRWAPNYKTDFKASEKDDFQDVVARRPVVRIMDFVDYDHDGQRSEFYLQTDTLPCGKNVGVVIGISPLNRKLHAFGTVSKPMQSLVLQKRIWEALSRAPGVVEIVDWPCGDHGSEGETTVRLHWTRKGIDGIRRSFTCPRSPRQRPISQEPL